MIKIKTSNAAIWLVKLSLLLIGSYFLYTALVDYLNEYVHRRGNLYTLEDNPRSFYISVIKSLFIGLVCIITAIFSFNSESSASPEQD